MLIQVARREYRGQRSVDAFSKFIKEQMTSRIIEFHALSDLNVDVSLIRKVKHVIKREKNPGKYGKHLKENHEDSFSIWVTCR